MMSSNLLGFCLCNICSGAGIISTITGLPPKKQDPFYCADWNRCGAVCEEQCQACYKADSMPEIIINNDEKPQHDTK